MPDTAYPSPDGNHHPRPESAPRRWLLIKGLGRHSGHWHDFPQRLAAATGAQVDCLDLPGTGEQRAQRSPASVAGIVDEVRCTWQRSNQPNCRSYVLGLSLGGMVALDWVDRYPGDFGGCVLVNTSAQGVAWPWERLRPPAMWAFARLALARRLKDRERIVLGLCTSGDPAIVSRYLEERVVMGLRAPVAIKTVAAQLYAASRYRAPQTTHVPLLVLAGEKDRLAHPMCSARLATRLGAQLRTHPDGGHEITLDAPDWVSKQVVEWTASHERQNADESPNACDGEM